MRTTPPLPTRQPPKPWFPLPVTIRLGDARVAGYVESVAGTGMVVQALEPLPTSLPADCEVLFETSDTIPAARGMIEAPDRAARRFRVSMTRPKTRGPLLLGATLLARAAGAGTA